MTGPCTAIASPPAGILIAPMKPPRLLLTDRITRPLNFLLFLVHTLLPLFGNREVRCLEKRVSIPPPPSSLSLKISSCTELCCTPLPLTHVISPERINHVSTRWSPRLHGPLIDQPEGGERIRQSPRLNANMTDSFLISRPRQRDTFLTL